VTTLLRGSALLSVLTLLLSACASRQAPPAAPADVPAVAPAPAQTVDAQLAVFEQQQKLRAHRAETEGRWADAALAWQVLALMHPGDAQIGVQLAAVRGQIESRLSERRAAAEAARQRGDLERAAEAYLDLLALVPGQRAAADALRQIERERNRRSQVARAARLQPPRGNATVPGMAAGSSADPADRSNSLREHATMLARQGDVDGAIQMLTNAARWRQQPALKSLLVDLYVQKAESLRQRQPQAARAAVDAALAIDRRHSAAQALLRQLSQPAGAAAARPDAPR